MIVRPPRTRQDDRRPTRRLPIPRQIVDRPRLHAPEIRRPLRRLNLALRSSDHRSTPLRSRHDPTTGCSRYRTRARKHVYERDLSGQQPRSQAETVAACTSSSELGFSSTAFRRPYGPLPTREAGSSEARYYHRSLPASTRRSRPPRRIRGVFSQRRCPPVRRGLLTAGTHLQPARVPVEIALAAALSRSSCPPARRALWLKARSLTSGKLM